MIIGNKNFDLKNNCYIMGILNFTPDSFSDGGKFNNIDSALKRAGEMIAEGADIIDIGGESTRPDYIKISEDEEISRIAPVIEAVKSEFDIPVSLDTYKYKVAQSGIKAGADMINDIWGLKYDNGEMSRIIAENNLPCCIMHNRNDKNYINFFEDVISDMEKSLETAEKSGINRDNIILDIGVGFAKSYANNLESIDRIDEFKNYFDMPVLLGTSRKSVIGNTLNLPPEERLEGTIATTVAGVLKGVSIVRVHDIRENARAVKMTTAIMKGYKNGRDTH